MYNNYKLEIYADSWSRYYSEFKTEFIDWGDETLQSIVRDPIIDFYQIEDGEIHLKEQIIKSKLLRVMYSEL